MKRFSILFLIILVMWTSSAFTENNLDEIARREIEKVFGEGWEQPSIEMFREGSFVYLIPKIEFRFHWKEPMAVEALREFPKPYLLPDTIENLLKKETTVTKADVKALLNSDSKFILINVGADERMSEIAYKKLCADGEVIGEFTFTEATRYTESTGSTGSEAQIISINYRGAFLDEGIIYGFGFSYNFSDQERAELAEKTGLFYTGSAGNVYWRDAEAPYSLYHMMQRQDRNMPVFLLNFQRCWNNIIGNLLMNNCPVSICRKRH